MKITGIENINRIQTTFRDLTPGDVFFQLKRDPEEGGWVLPNNDEIKIYMVGYKNRYCVDDNEDSIDYYGIRLSDGCILEFQPNVVVLKLRYDMEIEGIL